MFDIMAKNAKIILNALIDEIAHDGEMAIKQAYENRDFTNRTFNLHDSYGSAVYYNGKLIKRTVRYVGNEQANNGLNMGWVWDKPRSMPDFRGERRYEGDEVQMRGRDEVIDFFQKYTPKKKGIELVMVAAMFYATYLENGVGKMRRKYKVISSGLSAMRGLEAKYKGLLRHESTPRDLSEMTSIKDKSWS